MGFGFLGRGMPPAYFVIDISATSDAQAFKTTTSKLVTALVPFGGRLLIDADNVASTPIAAGRLHRASFSSRAYPQAFRCRVCMTEDVT
jgi:hypothetical protein